MEEVINELKKRVNNIEYKEIKEFREKMCSMEVSLNQANLLTESCIKSNEKMSDTLNSVKETMIIMSESMKQGNKVSEELANSVKSLGSQVNSLDNKMDEKFTEVDKKINQIDDKGKFDWELWIKNNFMKIIGRIMGIIGIIYIVIQYIKTLI